MQVAVDVGRKRTKAAVENRRVVFDSVIGSKATSTFAGIGEQAFSLNGDTAVVVEHPKLGRLEYEVGQSALAGSSTVWAPRHREQAEQDVLLLLSQGLKELGTYGKIRLCVGTPAQFYDWQKPVLERLLMNVWAINGHEVDIEKVVVLPQPVGTAWCLAVDQQGRVRPDAKAFFGRKVGVLDVGEYTTDAIVLDSMRYQAAKVVTIEYGCGNVAEVVADYLTNHGYPRRPHQVSEAVKDRRLAGIDLERVVAGAVGDGVRAILTEVGAVWDDRPEYSRIVVTGGGAYLFGERIRQAWERVEVAPLPEWANVMGYLAFLKFLGSK